MKLKICGMKNQANILEVAQLVPDYMGFIFWKKSPRFFDGILPEIPKTIQKVGVFVDASLVEIVSKIQTYQLDIIQLHGSESPEFCLNLKQQNIDIIKAFPVDEAFNFETLLPYESAVDYFLFDTKGLSPGGNGYSFDWSILKNYQSKKPIFLSGGIGPESISDLKKLPIPVFAVDVNSLFENTSGEKNIQLLQQFKIQLP